MQTPTHVVLVHTNRAWGGGEQQILLLLLKLRERGVMTTLLAHPGGQLYTRAQQEKMKVLPLPLIVRSGWPIAWRALVSLLANQCVDVIHAQDSRGLNLSCGLARFLRRPLVLSRRIASPVRDNFLSRRKYSISCVNLVLVVSETVRQIFVSSSGYPADHVMVAPDGLDLRALEQASRDGAWRVHYGATQLVCGLGKLAAKKNWDFMIRVAGQMAQQEPALHWLLAGEGPERRRLEQLARDLGVADRVHLLGFRSDAISLLKSCDLLFFPSMREGAAVTVREAMALGVPVVAANTPGVCESLAGHGWLVEPDDIAGAVTAVRAALTINAAQAEKLHAARKTAGQRYSIDVTVDATLKAYQRVCAV